ncbi:MAG: hypothetical protein JKY48_02480 [Flavobacteriales bacterium]|nr:hypothetical protein [Flavobacteriales bacterium]
MTFQPDLSNPNEGNQILRTSSGKVFAEKYYDFAPQNLSADVTDGVAGNPLQVSLDISGGIILWGAVTIVNSVVTAGTTMFEIPRVVGSSSSVTLKGNIRSRYSIALSKAGASFSSVAVILQPADNPGSEHLKVIAAEDFGVALEIYFDGIVIYPVK